MTIYTSENIKKVKEMFDLVNKEKLWTQNSEN